MNPFEEFLRSLLGGQGPGEAGLKDQMLNRFDAFMKQAGQISPQNLTDSLSQTTWPAMPAPRPAENAVRSQDAFVHYPGIFEPSIGYQFQPGASPEQVRQGQIRAAGMTAEKYRPKNYGDILSPDFGSAFMRAFEFLGSTSKAKKNQVADLQSQIAALDEDVPGASQIAERMLGSAIFAQHPFNIYKPRTTKKK